MKAEQIMTREVVTVKAGASVEELVELLGNQPFSGLPVVDGEGRVLGIVSEHDLLMHQSPVNFPPFINILGGIIYLEDLRDFNKKLKKSLAVRVDEVMTTDVVTIGKETTLREIARIMVEKKINRLPVVEDGKLIGIVSRADLVKAMEKGVNGG